MEPKQSTTTEPTTRDRVVDALLDDLAEVEVEALPEDTPTLGNVLASGDDDLDRKAAEEVDARLDYGDAWAWAVVRVVVRFDGFEGEAFLGGVTLAEGEGAEAFDPGGSCADDGDYLRREAAGEVADALLASGFYGAPGSVSTATLLLDDLADAYASTLDDLREARTLPPSDFDGDRLREHVAEVGEVDRLLGEVEGSRAALGDAWAESEVAPEQVDALGDALDAWALPGFAFGAHPGDGADFGFWPSDLD